MGCDIHLHTEVKINGEWHHYSAPPIKRNYALFALLANVRNEDRKVRPISKPRGIPPDATEVTLFDLKLWEQDSHSHSWIEADEIALVEGASASWRISHEYIDWESENVGYLFGNGWGGFSRFPESRPRGLEDIRWVFWFDN